MTIKDLKEGITKWKLTRERVINLTIGLTAILVYEFLARPIYRPFIYRNNINDFHIADTIGNTLGTIATIFVLIGFIGQGRTQHIFLIKTITISVTLYEIIHPLLGKPTNKAEMDNILNPLKLDINAFKKTIDDTRKEDIKDLTSLKKEIESLSKLNTQLSDDAQNLANALKADVKVQGNWGEDRLNLILETEGLQKYIDYSSQGSYRDEEQNVSRKPDFILNLPDGKHIVIDSKVSLTAYVNYFNAADTEEKAEYLKLHLKSLMDHIDNLADKNYQSLTGLNTPDYVFLFMPIEGALTLALNSNQDIFNRALKRKIVIITPTTLVATLKIIKIIWSKENQVKNVEEIFKQCGLLHDKFVMFIEEVEKIGSNLDTAKKSFKESMDRLTDGARKGDTIIGRFEKIKELGAKTNKSIPDKYITQIEMLPDNEISIDLETEADIQEIKTNSEIQNE